MQSRLESMEHHSAVGRTRRRARRERNGVAKPRREMPMQATTGSMHQPACDGCSAPVSTVEVTVRCERQRGPVCGGELDVCDLDECDIDEEECILPDEPFILGGCEGELMGLCDVREFFGFDPFACEDEEAEQPNGEDYDDPRTLSPKQLGRRGEDAACALLRRKDYVILERNWTCPAGEADIIALDDGCLVFVEVKTRAGIERGLPEEAVTARKRSRYERIAGFFLGEYEGPCTRVRFDVIGVLALPRRRALARHLVNAFAVGD